MFIIILVLYTLATINIAAVTLSVSELFCKRNSKAGRFIRFFLIRLREHSLTRFFVLSILLIFWGLVVCHLDPVGIWTIILLLFTLLLTVHPEVFLTFRKHRKKAEKKNRAVRITKKAPETADSKETSVLPELTPITPQIQE